MSKKREAMTTTEIQRCLLRELDEARADVIRNHADDLLYYEGYRDALESVASVYLGIPLAVLGDNPSWDADAEAGRDWDDEGEEIADEYLKQCALTLPQRIATLEAQP